MFSAKHIAPFPKYKTERMEKQMRFTKGLVLGTALGISAAYIMNNKDKISAFQNKPAGITAQTETEKNDYAVNDII